MASATNLDARVLEIVVPATLTPSLALCGLRQRAMLIFEFPEGFLTLFAIHIQHDDAAFGPSRNSDVDV